MGLAEGEEICRIELELAAAANDELAEEIREFRRKVREHNCDFDTHHTAPLHGRRQLSNF
jgi:hypothetical protein